jgi:hypothetical protein
MRRRFYLSVLFVLAMLLPAGASFSSVEYDCDNTNPADQNHDGQVNLVDVVGVIVCVLFDICPPPTVCVEAQNAGWDQGFEQCETDLAPYINQCLQPGVSNCGANATCINTTEGFTCECNEGYGGDGVDCSPVVMGIGTTLYSQTQNDDDEWLMSGGDVRVGMELDTGHSLVGEFVDSVLFNLTQRSGGAGLAYARVRDSSDVVRLELGTVEVSGLEEFVYLVSGYQWVFFHNATGVTLQEGDRILIEFTGDGQLGIARGTNNPQLNTHHVKYNASSGSYSAVGNEDPGVEVGTSY